MLPTAYKFYVWNECGQTLAAGAVDVDIVAWKFSTTGVLTYGTEATRTTAGTVATGAGSDIGAVISNASDLNLGAHCRISITTPASADGAVSVYLVKSHDGTDYEDSRKHLIAAFSMGASETQVQTVEI